MNDRIVRYFDNTLSPEERIALLQEVKQNSELKDEFNSYKNLLALTSFREQSTDQSEGLAGYHLFLKKQKRASRRKLFMRIGNYAAAIIILVLGTVITTNYINEPVYSSSINTLHAPAGQRAVVTLSDGTKVWLNANSTITYPAQFADDERLVTLVGEAFFEVTKSEESNFIVSSKDLKTKVLGTKFNVSSYPDAEMTTVSLLEGAVEVLVNNESNKLQPYEQLRYENGSTTVVKFTERDEFMWVDGVYSFNNKTLKEVAKKLELYYDVKIIIANKKLENLVLTGKFRQRDGVVEIFKVLQKIHSFTIVKDEEKNTITLK